MSEERGNSEGSEPQHLYTPAVVARRLHVSGQALRRLAATYERVYAPLQRDERGRMWTMDDIERLEEARALVRAGRAASVEAALRAMLEGAVGPGEVEVHPAEPGAGEGHTEASRELLEELRGLRAAVERQNELLEQQGRRLEALEGSAESTPPAGLAAQTSNVQGTPVSRDTTTRGAPALGERLRRLSSWWSRR